MRDRKGETEKEGRGERPSEIHGETEGQREEGLRNLNSQGSSLADVPVCAMSCWGCSVFWRIGKARLQRKTFL